MNNSDNFKVKVEVDSEILSDGTFFMRWLVIEEEHSIRSSWCSESKINTYKVKKLPVLQYSLCGNIWKDVPTVIQAVEGV